MMVHLTKKRYVVVPVLVLLVLCLFAIQGFTSPPVAFAEFQGRPAPGAKSKKDPTAGSKESVMKAASLTQAEVQTANRLVTDKQARAPYLTITVNGKSMPGYDTINLYQKRAEPEDLYMLILLKSHVTTGKLPPPPAVEDGAQQVLTKTYGQLSGWKMAAIRNFWGSYATTNFKASELKNPSHKLTWFVYYLMDKSTARQKASNAKLAANVRSTEAWNRAMQGWQKHQSNISQRADQAQTMRSAYLTEWDAEWAVRKSIEAVQSGY